MKLKPIRTEAEYDAALAFVEPFFDKPPKKGSPEDNEFEVMTMLIEAYEREHYPIAPPTPIEAIKFRMEQGGMTVKNLASVLHSTTSRAYEVLNGTRNLTLTMIRALHHEMAIPAESLIAEQPRSAKTASTTKQVRKAGSGVRSSAKAKRASTVGPTMPRTPSAKPAGARSKSAAKA